MNVSIIGQGYDATSESSAGHKIASLFSDSSLHTFLGISAFASVAGVAGLADLLADAEPHLKSASVIVGIDQKGTSKEALEELLALNVNAYIFYQPGTTIFHPKVYLFEGDTHSELIVGSSNLTAQGLFANVEASVHIQFDHALEADRVTLQQLKDGFSGLFDFSDPNLQKLSVDLIIKLVGAKLVPTEAERKILQGKTEMPKTGDNLSGMFPKRPRPKIPSTFSGKRTARRKSHPSGTGKAVDLLPKKLVWKSGPLTARDLNIPKSLGTNPTGSMLLKKGRMVGIDQRHYFRDTVFKNLNWQNDPKPKSAHLERSIANFTLIIDGKKEGKFALTITHNPKTNTAAYQQNNSMTQISWGTAKSLIARDELIGKSAYLSATDKVEEFILEIR